MAVTVEPVSTVNDCATLAGLYIEIRGHGHPNKAAIFRCTLKALNPASYFQSDEFYDLLSVIWLMCSKHQIWPTLCLFLSWYTAHKLTFYML